ncbi:MAG: ABC transporter permease [Chloroflexi bacterium]|nr:ABC transporter permease [Chloroflexota bacterium]
MNILESLGIALQALSANKLRSGLTVLGIVIGVAAVISLMSIGQGSQAAVAAAVQGIGTNLLFVRPGTQTVGGVRGGFGTAQTLTLDDAEALADPIAAPAVALVAPELTTGGRVVAQGQNLSTRVVGVTPAYMTVRNYTLAEGSFITEQHLVARSAVVVLGANVAQTLFGDSSPLEQTIRISNRPFRVIGVLDPKGGSFLGMQDDVVLAPLTTVRFRLFSQRTAQGGVNVQLISVQVADAAELNDAKEQVTTILRQRHRATGTGEDDFTITSQQDILNTFNQVTGVLTLFLGAVAGISLVVGGIGIMNIMLVSVTERIREIGIRKAVGAKRKDILMQFLIEAMALSLLGGLLGLGSGWGLAQLFATQEINGQRIQTLVSADIVMLALAVSVATGLFFGIYPAYRAARLEPIDALRHE